MTTEPIIEIEKVSKKYLIGHRESYISLRDQIVDAVSFKKREKKEEFWALKDINMTIERGQNVGIIGKNGAGKSTLLKILSQITPPTHGKITMRGRVASLLEVGTGFNPELTGRENIYLNGAILGMTRKEISRKFDEIVAFSEVEKFLDTPVKRYSSGMYVRLAFAVAAHLEPEILIVDEVLAVGDAEFQKKCLGKMSEVGKNGRTVIFVSHNMGAIANLCSKVLVLDHGKEIFFGDTQAGITKYIENRRAESGQKSWGSPEKAPGGENVKLKSVKILSNGKVTADVSIDKEVQVEICYWNLKEGALLGTDIHLKDELGSYILATADYPSTNLVKDEWYGKPRPVGLYKTVCTFPANFLNERYYSIDFGVANNRREYELNIQDVMSFTGVDTGEMKKEYNGDWVGLVRPKLSWQTEKISKELK